MYSPFLGQLSRLYPSSATALPPNDIRHLDFTEDGVRWAIIYFTTYTTRWLFAGKTGVSMTAGPSKTFWVECCYSRHWIHGPRREARVMALFPVKNGPQYRSENQYRGGFIAAFAPWLPEEGKPRLLYKPYRGRWMGSQSRLKWFRKHPSFTILFITWSSRRQIGQDRKKKGKIRQFWVWLVGK